MVLHFSNAHVLFVKQPSSVPTLVRKVLTQVFWKNEGSYKERRSQIKQKKKAQEIRSGLVNTTPHKLHRLGTLAFSDLLRQRFCNLFYNLVTGRLLFWHINLRINYFFPLCVLIKKFMYLQIVFTAYFRCAISCPS